MRLSLRAWFGREKKSVNRARFSVTSGTMIIPFKYIHA